MLSLWARPGLSSRLPPAHGPCLDSPGFPEVSQPFPMIPSPRIHLSRDLVDKTRYPPNDCFPRDVGAFGL